MIRHLALATLALALCILAGTGRAIAAGDLSGAHDFDFEFGGWNVHHRVKRATGEWIEFEGTANARPILGGLGNVEDCLFHRPAGDTRGVAMHVRSCIGAVGDLVGR